MLAARRTAYDEMMWQAPALSLTAQAFLLTIALGPGTTTVARLIASFLSGVAATASVILMRKHRAMEVMCSCRLEDFERATGRPLLHQRPSFADQRFWVQWSSSAVWTVCLALFGVAALFVLVHSFIVAVTCWPGWLK